MSAERIPIGFQLVGRAGGEADLLRLGHAYEEATPWHTMHPPLDVAVPLI
jgi:aspartyl-tRNA(Asn)/glutamyl-tRNA(Gln) amidotransferase subunit A